MSTRRRVWCETMTYLRSELSWRFIASREATKTATPLEDDAEIGRAHV